MYLTREPIEMERLFTAAIPADCGALATFAGVVRDHDHGRRVTRLYYEGYEPLAEKLLERIISTAREKWQVGPIRLQHRLGWLNVGEIAVAIAVASAHRSEAFSACREIIDTLKHQVPIWKKEVYADGQSEWVLCTHG